MALPHHNNHEVNHELIRRILLKGSSFDDLTQSDIYRMMDHINSYKRKKLNNRIPHKTLRFYYGEDVLKKLGCSPVAPENIILKLKLLKKQQINLQSAARIDHIYPIKIEMVFPNTKNSRGN